MTWIIKTRGASNAPIIADYRCDACGIVFELVVERPAPDLMPCPDCCAPAKWTVSAPRIKHQLFVSCHRGKSDPMPYAEACDTEPLADGMPLKEWKERRAKMWNDVDYAEFKRATR